MQGKVAFVNERNWQGKNLYSFKLADDEALYVCGTSKPQISKGDFVTFEANPNPKGQMVVNLASLEAKKVEVVSAGSAGKAAWGGKSGYNDDKRQRTIEWQAARNSAIAAAQVVLSNGALKLPAKESAKYEAVMALIGELTKQFFDETATLGEKPKTATLPTVEEPEKAEKEEGNVGDEWD